MSELPTPISDQDKLLSNIAIGTPDIEDLIPNSRQEVYLKYIALNGIHELPVSISQGGTGGTTSEEARQNLGINLPLPINNGGTGGTNAGEARTNLEVMKGYVLYSNSSGTYGTITLSDSYTNYQAIEILYEDNTAYNTTVIRPAMVTQAVLDNTYMHPDGTKIYIHSCLIKFSGTSATISRNALATLDETPTIAIGLYDSSNPGIKVHQITGYKY